jgi:1,4-dihydroxy-2-naphthoate octaprenyltransferase
MTHSLQEMSLVLEPDRYMIMLANNLRRTGNNAAVGRYTVHMKINEKG